MRKLILCFEVLLGCVAMSLAQVPYYGATVGKGRFYGYHSVKYRPGVNDMATYTTLHYGVASWLSVGTDLSTGKDTRYIGYNLRVGRKFSTWFSAGLQVTPSFDMNDSHRFGYNSTGLFLNGNILKDSRLFWVSNTWHTIYRGGEDTLDQWTYLGSYLSLTKNTSIWPHVGMGNSWEFDRNVDLAMGIYYVYKNVGFYLWGNDFLKEHMRGTVGVDFVF